MRSSEDAASGDDQHSRLAQPPAKKARSTPRAKAPHACDEPGCDYRATTASRLIPRTSARTAASGRTRAEPLINI
jgi:hypothetical protein